MKQLLNFIQKATITQHLISKSSQRTERTTTAKSETEDIIKNLKINKAKDYDGIIV